MKTPKISGVVIVRGEKGLVRIAHTQDVRKRMSEWQAASPTELKIVGLIREEYARNFYAWTYCFEGNRTDWNGSRGVYKWLKSHFAPRCVNRDWFALDDKAILSLPFERPS